MITEHNGVKFYVSNTQSDTIEFFTKTSNGFSTIHSYTSTSGRVTPEVANINFISRFKLSKLYERRIAALTEMTFADIAEDCAKDEKLSECDAAALETLFNTRRDMEIASCQTTLDGNREDARRQAHDRCYVYITDGVKIHLKTEKVNGIMQPVLVDGIPMAETIMVSMIEIGRKVLKEGEYKQVNSGLPVRMSNIIARHLPRSTKIKTLSLREDNFDKLTLMGEEIVPEDIAGLFT